MSQLNAGVSNIMITWDFKVIKSCIILILDKLRQMEQNKVTGTLTNYTSMGDRSRFRGGLKFEDSTKDMDVLV